MRSVCRHWLPSYRATFLTVGLLHALLAASLFGRGLATSMAEFKVPAALLVSPHYLNAIGWVYVHQIVLGLLIAALGLWLEAPPVRRRLARLLLAVHLLYAGLDFRASDSVLGDGLYQGPASLFPGIYCAVVALLMLHLSFCRAAVGEALGVPNGTPVEA